MKLALFFTDFNADHLFKDVGMIPFHFNEHGYSIDIICKKRPSADELTKEEKFVYQKFNFIEYNPIKTRWADIKALYWAALNAHHYDLFIFFHDTLETKFLSILTRILNRKARILIKLDIDSYIIENKIKYLQERPKIRELVLRLIDRAFSRSVDFLLAETSSTHEKINGLYDKAKIFLLPNAVPNLYESLLNNENEKKEDIIITVGRLGSSQKNNEALLAALELLQPVRSWRVFFVGNYTDDFKIKVQDFKNSEKFQIILQGSIKSKPELLSLYSRSKLFCSTSRYEGMALSYVEALFCGTPILTTAVSGAEDTAIAGVTGFIIDQNDIDAYASRLGFLIENDELLEQLSKNARELSARNFRWTPHISRLCKALKDDHGGASE